jgi:hypothetical protein
VSPKLVNMLNDTDLPARDQQRSIWWLHSCCVPLCRKAPLYEVFEGGCVEGCIQAGGLEMR